MRTRVNAFTTSYPEITRVLFSPAKISKAFIPAPNAKPPVNKEYKAIWDTGATGTVISQKVVDDLDLKPAGMTKVRTAGGETLSPVYFICLVLPNNVATPQLRVTRGIITDADVLIGMDIISGGDFVVTNKDGKTVLTFRMPSIQSIDFVKGVPSFSKPSKKLERIPKVSRNAPCPCGSGKKYKHCHGNKPTAG